MSQQRLFRHRGSFRERRWSAVWISGALAALAAACSSGSSDATEVSLADEPSAPAPSGPEGASPAAPADSRFVLCTIVTDDEGSNAYVSVLPSLDLGGARVNQERAREFPGNADLWVRGGKIFVASGDEPAITRYAVDEQGDLIEEQTLSFAGQGVQSAAFWNNTFISDERAYMANGVSEYVIWNPTTMLIEGTLELPPLPERDGLVATPGLADRSNQVVAGKLYQPIYWTDSDYARRTDDSRIAVIDVEKGELIEYLSAPCPGLDYSTRAADGRLYFSNWTGGVGTHYVLGTAPNCVVVLDPADGSVRRAFDFSEITGGHEGAALAYVNGDRFSMSVFHEEKLPDLAAAADPFEIIADRNWQLVSYDAASGSAEPVGGIDWNSGAVYYTRVGSRLLPLVPGENYASTQVYDLGDGTQAAPLFATAGWVLRVFALGEAP